MLQEFHFFLDVFVSFTYNHTVMEGETFDFCVGIVFTSSRLIPEGFVELNVSVSPGSAAGITLQHAVF